MCDLFQLGKQKISTPLRIFLNEILKVNKERRGGSLYHGKRFKLSDGRSTRDRVFWLIPAIYKKTINHINTEIVIMSGAQ